MAISKSKTLSYRIALASGLSAALIFIAYVLVMVLAGTPLLPDHPSQFAVLSVALGFLGIGVLMLVVQRLVERLLGARLARLRATVAQAAAGNPVVRAAEDSEDEVGELSVSFNHLLRTITDLSARNIDSDLELGAARRELTLKATIEEKNRIIEATNARLEERLHDISTLLDLSQALNQDLGLDGAITRLVEFVSRRLRVDWFVLLLADEAGEILEARGVWGFPRPEDLVGVTFTLGEGIVGTVFESGHRIVLPDIAAEERFTSFKGRAQMSGSFVGIPARFSDNRVGVLAFGRRRLDAFEASYVDFLQIVTNHVAMVIRNARLYERMKELATQDELTGLANRRYLLQRMEHEFRRHKRFGTPMAVLMVDVDHFKRVNDRYGHPAGDAVLREVARALESAVRDVDVVGRYGGEEFSVVLPSTRSDAALLVADKVRLAVQERCTRPGDEGAVTVSVGVGVASETTDTVHSLIDIADQALYRAKTGGRNRVGA
ncbi:MAG: hypothetical protein AMXMBFR64_60350 [Myxococcales bacterium]